MRRRLVGSLVRRKPVTITPKDTLLQAAEKMAAENVGALVVVEADNPNKPVAVISERDIVKAIAIKMPLSTPIEAFMSTGVVSVGEDADVDKAAELMIMHNIRHLVVVNKKGELVGMVSIRDVLRELKSPASP
ncbi:CBS domain-containing protein [Pyrobaculum sp. 3827-6]|uniref:CBS domain-containing protein n=1 Tax=Pyrobaculum sp. 3827-6 TaxID=2983604 RepID=UPI0021DA47AF|nr:CBS domain-containing protein [Pyrobaculum sp. 3827-6]MCU7786739.1 CBS domain-containing protein [Pyrobaculum sp. 3827-6]